MQITIRLRRRIAALAGTLILLLTGGAFAFELRVWLTADGRMTEGTFVRTAGDSVELKNKNGQMIKLSRALLSFGDLDYVKKNSPPGKESSLGNKPSTAAKIPNPAKEAPVDRKQFKENAGDQIIGVTTYRVCETPHFKILHLPPADPFDVGELAERLWTDTAFFHGSFMEKWKNRRMAIVLTNDDAAFANAMRWSEWGALDRTGPQGSTGTATLRPAVADKIGIFSSVRVLRGCIPPQAGRKSLPIKGVWIPLQVNALAEDLLHIGGHSRENMVFDGIRGGNFALYTGTAYDKEILLTGRSETFLVERNEAGKTKVKEMPWIQPGKPWAAQLKKLMKKGGEWTPRLREVMMAGANDAGTGDIVFAYAFSRFLQNSTDRLAAFDAFLQKPEGAYLEPDLQEIAKHFGFNDAAALEKAWIEWMDSPLFH